MALAIPLSTNINYGVNEMDYAGGHKLLRENHISLDDSVNAKKEFDKAIVNYQHYLNRSLTAFDSAYANMALAFLYTDNKDWELSVEVFSRGIANYRSYIKNDPSEGHTILLEYFLAIFASRIGLNAQALTYFKEAITSALQCHIINKVVLRDSYASVSFIYYRNLDYTNAVEFGKKALEISENDNSIRYLYEYIGEIYEQKLKDPGQSAAYYSLYLQTNPPPAEKKKVEQRLIHLKRAPENR